MMFSRGFEGLNCFFGACLLICVVCFCIAGFSLVAVCFLVFVFKEGT